MDKLAAEISKNHEETKPFNFLFSSPLRDIIIVSFLLFIVVGGMYSSFKAGRTYASELEMFQVADQSPGVPEVVVLRIYGEYLVTAPFDRANQTFEKKLYLLKISEMATVPLTFETVGV